MARASAAATAVALVAAMTGATLTATPAWSQAAAGLPPPAAPSAPPPTADAEPGGDEGVLDPPTPAAPPAQSGAPLSESDRYVLARGPVTSGEWVLGGILGTWLGFGVGHAAQGRWTDAGILFTGAELLSLTALFTGFSNAGNSSIECSEFGCRERRSNNEVWTTVGVVGGIGFAVFRIWEIIDVWYGPGAVNRRYEEVRNRTGRWSLSLLPRGEGGGDLSFALRF